MFKKLLLTGILATSLVNAYAANPTLSLSSTGNTDTVSMNVTGDANTPVVLYYTSTVTSSTQSASLGNTDANGNFSTTISTASYNISSSVPVYVMLNGYVSPSVTWPYTTPTTTFGLSQTSATLTAGQSTTISVTGLGSYYISNNTGSAVASASVNGSTLTVTGINAGTSVITLCQTSNNSSCLNFTVTVNPIASTTATTTTGMTFSPHLAVGQTLTMDIMGNTSPYYLSSTANSAFSVSVTGTSLTIAALAIGSGQVSICSSNGMCSTFFVTVDTAPTISTPVATVTTTPTKYMFYNALTFGQTSNEVIELQKRLAAEGYFTGDYSPHFGSQTLLAVKAYQRAHGLTQLGNVGPGTRAALNQ